MKGTKEVFFVATLSVFCCSELAYQDHLGRTILIIELTLRKMSGDESVMVEAAGAPPGETLDLMTALQLVLRKSLAYGGLVRGLHEGAKAIEKHAAQLCVLAEDCNQPDYIKLVKALCADHNISLISVPSAKTLGE